jgi:subtilisin-like proprotein convertase family protein
MKNVSLYTFLLAAILCMTIVDVAAAVRYVKPTATGTGTGNSWANASGNLQAMIDASAVGDEVWVATGTYKPSAYPTGCSGCSTARDYTFHLKNGVKVYGGFAGTETLLTQRNITANPTILSGDFNNDDVVTGSSSTLSITGNTENAYHVVLSVSDAATTVLDGFTVRGGNANVSSSSITVEGQSIFRSSSGGMHNNLSSPTVNNCTFTGNSAISNGSAMYNNNNSSPTVSNCTFTANSANFGSAIYNNSSSSPSITNCTFTGNLAILFGGAIYNSSSSPTITNTTFINNSADSGGAIYNSSSSPSITNSTFNGNSATSAGGAMYNNSTSSAIITNSIFTGNSADRGGAMYNSSSSSSLSISNCTFSSNTGRLGGTIHNNDASPTITNCTFADNHATSTAGGIYNLGTSSPTITNCAFAGNTAAVIVGAIGNFNTSTPTITNCTFFNNSAPSDGGIENNAAGTVITNCIIWGNSAQITGDFAPTVTYSIVQGGYTGMGNLNADPQFVNATIPAGLDGIHRTADDGLRLGLCSPAINAGTTTGAPSTDIIGTSRPQFTSIDMGAYESTNNSNIPAVNISGTTTGCSVTLTASGGLSYAWSGGNTPASATNTFTTSGIYTVSVTVTNSNGCTASAGTVVEVFGDPVISSATATPATICTGENSNLNLNVTLPPLIAAPTGGSLNIPSSGNASPYPSTIEVSGVSGTISNLKVTIANLSHTWPSDIDMVLFGPTGAHSIIFTDAIGSSTGITGRTYTFQTGATALPLSGYPASGTYGVVNGGSYSGSGTPSTVTNTGLGTFNGTNPNGTWSLYVYDQTSGDIGSIGSWSLEIATDALATYVWSPATYLNNTAIANPTALGVMATTAYTVMVTGTGGCTATASATVTVAGTLPTANISGATTGCGSVTLTASGGTSYAWNGGNNPTSATNTFTSSDTYTVTVTGEGGCAATASAVVTVNTVPVISSVTATPATICADENSSLNVTLPPSIVIQNGGSLTIPSSGNASPYPSAIAVSGVSGNISNLKVTITNLSHTYPSDIDMVLFGPTGAHSIIFTDAIGSSTGITGRTYTFQTGATALPLSGYPASGTYGVVNGGSYSGSGTPSTVTNTGLGTFNGTNPNGTWSLYVFDDVDGDSGNIGSWSLEITTASAVTYAWSPATYLNSTTTANPTAVGVLETTEYTVTVTGVGGCTATASTTVTVAGTLPTANISGTTTGCGSVTLTASGGTSYAWNGGNNPTSATNTFTSSGTYTVTVTGSGGCTATASIAITANNTPPTAGITNNTGTTILTCITYRHQRNRNGRKQLCMEWRGNSHYCRQ